VAEEVLRRGTAADVESCHRLLWEAATDLGRRQGTPLEGSEGDWWLASEPLHRFLAAHAAEWWVAEDPDRGELRGYARSIERGGLFELTEFFVRPGEQSRGLGRSLLEHAFPVGRGEVRSIIATGDVRAMARYYRADTVAQFPILTMAGEPGHVESGDHLTPVRLAAGDEAAAAVATIEGEVLGYPRSPPEIAWLVDQREGYLYRSDGHVVGFGFVGASGSGPIAALDPTHLPEILLHLEGAARRAGIERVEIEVPSRNAIAVRHLLSRGFRFDPWINFLMANQPFGRFDRYVGFSPPMFL
jgi:GNAT superfamily N-acetyltransferase